MKKIIGLISLLCIVCLIGGCSLVTDVNDAGDKTADKKDVVVTVDGKEYGIDRFNLYFYDAQDEYLKDAGYTNASEIPADFWDKKVDGKKTNLEVVKEKALADLIDDVVAYNKAIERDITISNDEKSYISNQISQLKQDKVSLAQFEYMGISVDEFEDYYMESAYIQYLISQMVEKEEIVPEEADVSKYYETEFVKAKHILIPTINQETNQPLSEKAVEEAKQKAADILNKIKSGADFDEIMNTESKDPGLATAPEGYVFTKGEMVLPFEKAAFALKINEVSDLVTTDYGIHIIKRVPFNPEGEAELQAYNTAKQIVAEKEFKKQVKVWKSKADIKTNDKVLKKVEPTIIKNEE